MSRRQTPFSFPRRAAAPAPAQAGHRPLLLVMALAAGFTAMQVRAQPAGAQAVVGTAALSQQGNKLTVTTTNGAGGFSAINWQSFSVPGGTVTHFAQPGATSTSLNRVVGPDPSAIFGTLSSNGRLVLVNPNGITVGAGAVVDTAAFTASTLRMTDADFLAGRMRFADPIGGLLKVDGQVLARSGDVVLIGQQVETGPQAVVLSPQGATVLAAGQKVEVTGRGLEGIVFEVQAPTDTAVNLGTLRGDAVGVFAGTLRHSGLVQAQAVSADGGRVVLKAAGNVTVAGGAVEAQGAGGKGGTVDVLGARVELSGGARIDASGANAGGLVRIGGDYQGANAAIPNALETSISADSQVRANATDNGNGGRVIVWADDTTRAYGRLEAKAGPQGGDGGLIETSGKRLLDVSGVSIDASSARGAAGLWLLDPADIKIVHGAAGGPAGPGFAPLGNTTITDGTLNSAIDGGTAVTVSTTSGTVGSAGGDITFDSQFAGGIQLARSVSGNNTITFSASRDILFTQGTTSFTAAPTGGLGVTLTHGGGRSTSLQNLSTLNIGTGVSATTGTLSNDGGSLVVTGNVGVTAFKQNLGMAFLDGGNFNAGTVKVADGTLQLSGGSVQATTFQQTGGVVQVISPSSSLSVGSAFSSTGGTFDFSGNNLAIQQASGDLVIPAGNGSISAAGSLSLSAASGNLTVNRSLSVGHDAFLSASGAVKFGQLSAGGLGGNVTVSGASVGSSGGPNQILVLADSSGNAGKVTVQSTAGAIDIAEIFASGSGVGGSGGDVSLNAVGGGITLAGFVDTRASNMSYYSTGGHGGNVGFTATGAVKIGGIRSGGSNGGDGGRVTLSGASVESASAASPAAIETMGQFDGTGPGNGSKGGDVSISTTGGNISLGSIITQGGGGSLGNGSGGSVLLAGTNGQVSVDLIRTDASQRGFVHQFAGAAGNVDVTTSGSASLGKILLGAVSAQGASGGGSGGRVTITGVGDVSLDTARAPGAINAVSTRSWEGAGPASSGNIAITSSSGNLSVVGALESSGAGMSGGSVGSITLSAAAAGKTVSAQDVLAFASVPFTGDASGTSGGNISVTAGGDLKVGNVIASGSGGLGNGGNGGAINLQSGGKVAAGQVQSFGGNGATLGGKGGGVTIAGAGNVTIGTANISTTSIVSSGAQGADGGSGGNVSVSSAGGSITVFGGVSASGGNATVGRAGSGGAVRLTATGTPGATAIFSGNMFTAGGHGPMGGRGGDVTVTTAGDIEVGGSTVSILAQGGNGLAETGGGGNVSLASSGGKVKAAGVIQTFAGFAQTPAVPTLGGSGGSVRVSSATSVELGHITAWGSTGSTSMGRGGNVTVAAGSGNLTVGNVDARGYVTTTSTSESLPTTLGGAGGQVTLTSGGGGVSAGSIATYGGGGTTGGSAGGALRVQGAGPVAVGEIRTFGGRGDHDGGAAGAVSLVSSAGTVGTKSIDAQGGWASGGTGGAGGNVMLSGPAGVTAEDIRAYGGVADNGGAGGSITIASSGGSILAGHLQSGGGSAFSSGAAGTSGTVGISGGGMVSLQAITTNGQFGGTGSAAGNVNISAAGDIVINPSNGNPYFAINAYGGGGSLGPAPSGATVTLASSGGNISVGRVSATGGFGTTGGSGGRFTASAPNGNVAVGMVDVSGGHGMSGTGGTGGTVTVTAGKGVQLGEVFAEGGSGGFSPTLGSAGGQGGNISVTVSQGDLDLSGALLSVSGGTGGWSDHVGGTGGGGGKVVITATSGSVSTSAPYDGSYGTEIYADGGSGGTSMSPTSVAGDRGGTGGAAGSIVINSGSSARLFGGMSAGGGEGGAASNSETALAVGGTGGSGSNGSIAVNVTGQGQTLTLGGTVYAAGGARGLANWSSSEDPTNVMARAGSNGSGMGTFTATAGGGVFIPSAETTPLTGESFNPLEAGASLAIKANWTNNGALALHSGAWLVSGGPINNNGAIELGFGSVVSLGNIAFDSEANPVFSPLSNTLINGSAGIVRGFGTIDGHLVNQGTVSPGMSFAPFGQITVNGHYNQTSTGRLVVQATPQGPYFPGTNHDQLRVLGAVTLGGTLEVREMALPVSQVTQAVSPSAQQLAEAGSTSVLFLDAPAGIQPGSGFSSVTAPTSLRSLLLVQNGATLQNVDGVVVVPPAPPAPPPPAATPPAPTPAAPAPVAAPTPAPAPVADTSDAELVDSAVALAGNTTREVVQEALTQSQATTTTYAASSKTDEKKDEKKKDAEVITTTTSCKPG